MIYNTLKSLTISASKAILAEARVTDCFVQKTMSPHCGKPNNKSFRLGGQSDPKIVISAKPASSRPCITSTILLVPWTDLPVLLNINGVCNNGEIRVGFWILPDQAKTTLKQEQILLKSVDVFLASKAGVC